MMMADQVCDSDIDTCSDSGINPVNQYDDQRPMMLDDP